MSRRRAAEKREVLPDAKFGDVVLSKFMNTLMERGKKSVAERVVYGALDEIEAKLKQDPVPAFHEALENVKPAVEVRSRRVGGATYQVPAEVRPERRPAPRRRPPLQAPRRGPPRAPRGAAHPLDHPGRARPVGPQHDREALGRAP